MELNIKEITITIINGAYLLFGLEFLFYIFLKRSASLHLLHLLETRKLSPRVLAVVAVVSCFAFGMLVEALSDKLVDEDTFMQRSIIGPIPGSKTDDEIKQEILFGSGGTAVPMAMEFAYRDLFRRYGGKHGETIQQILLCNKGVLAGISTDDRKATAKILYYHSKNTVYKTETYFGELQTIQLRIDFARTCIALSSFLIAIALTLFVTTEIVRAYRFRQRSRRRKISQKKQRANLKRIKKIFHKEDRTRRIRFTFVLGFLALSFLATVFAYNAEEANYDKRAFGYFSSMNAESKVEAQCQ